MRLILKVALASAACTAMLAGPAFAAPPTGQTFTAPCGGGTISFPDGRALWPPDHKYHPYPVTYAGGAPGDVVTVSARSSDGAGVETSDPQSATVPPGATSATAAVGLFAEHMPVASARLFVVSFGVSGSNSCGGLVLVVPPENGRPTA